MKIAVIASLYDPYVRGGAEVFASNIVGELKKDHDIFVITTDEWRGFRSLLPRCEIRDGVAVYRFYPLNIFSFIHINEKPFFFRILWSVIDIFNLHSIIVIASIMRKEKPDMTMVHALKGLSYGVATLLNWMKIRWMLTPHDVQLVIPSGRLYSGKEQVLNSPVTRLYVSLTKILIGSPTWVVFSSRFLARFYSDRGFFVQSRFSVLPSPAPSVPVIHRNAAEHPMTFLFVGQLETPKGILELVDAFERLPMPDVRLKIMGSGSLEKQMKEACVKDSRIELVGYKQNDEKFKVFASCDYAIVCSQIYENSPSVVYEAFSLSIPVITIDLGGAAELVRDGENGFVYNPKDHNGLLKSLERAVAEKQYEKLSRSALASIAGLALSDYVPLLVREYTQTLTVPLPIEAH